ncbi:hypothetical protein, partial [Enterococcus faecium]
AVKHNIAMPTKPLEVKIYCDDLQNLIIINNLQKKVSSIASNKTGLNSISSKYKLLNQPDISIEETVTHFKVTIPLIKNKDYAG